MDFLGLVSAIVNTLLFILLLLMFLYKKWKKTSNRILLALLATNFLYTLNYLFFHLDMIPRIKFKYLNLAGDALFLMMALLIYFYAKSLCLSDYKITIGEHKYFLPPLIFVFTSILYFFIFVLKRATSLDFDVFVAHSHEMGIFYSVLHLLILAYVLGVLRVLRKYREEIKAHFSTIVQIDITWFFLVFFAFIAMWIIEIGLQIQTYLPGSFSFYRTVLSIFSVVINIVFIVFLVKRGLKQVEIFNGVREKTRTDFLKLPDEKINSYAEMFKNHLQVNKPYTQPHLTLSEVAEQLSIPSRHLSYTINRYFNKNFFDIISDHRINEAKRMLKDPNNKKKSILEICYDVGFNSKASFNSLFKKKTGLTPSQFRKL